MYKKPRWILNGTTLVMGGALQACVNFIIEAANDKEAEWYYLVSKQIAQQLTLSGIVIPSHRLQVYSTSPARDRDMRRRIKCAVDKLDPEAIFTFFGPSYIKFECLHISGFADSWVLNPNKHAIATLPSLSEKIKTNLLGAYKKYWLKKADFWIVETEAAQSGLARALACDNENIAVVPNGCRDVFSHIQASEITRDGAQVRLLCLSAYYPHKNFELVPYVAKALRSLLPGQPFSFVLSVSENVQAVKAIADKARELGVSDCMDFIGPVNLENVPALYEQSHIAFIPTLLEAFSATYSESMASGLPIVTSDLDFARAACKDGAYYFTPNDAEEAAKTIVECIADHNRRKEIIANAKAVSNSLPDAKEKYLLYKKFITDKTIEKIDPCAA